MANNPRYFITTAIDYPNSRPHIGTAFEKIGADVQARFRRMEGFDVHFLMGNDENTIKVPQRRELSVTPQEYVDDMARQFQDVWRALDISYDEFIQTSEPRHHAGCQKFIQAVFDAGDIYKGVYQGHYCNGCETFKTEKEVEEGNGRCPNHPEHAARRGSKRTIISSASRRIAKIAGALRGSSRIHPAREPPQRGDQPGRNRARDIAITRKGFSWGIKVPFDPDQTIYVWFDALLNYITGIGYGTDEERFRRLWPATCT